MVIRMHWGALILGMGCHGQGLLLILHPNVSNMSQTLAHTPPTHLIPKEPVQDPAA